MVLEAIKLEWVERRPFIALFFGLVYAILGYLIATIFFGHAVSVAMLFLATLLAVPSLIMMIEREERVESAEGLQHFIRNHKGIIEAYLFLFIGIFLGYVLLGIIGPEFNAVFDFQVRFLERQEGLSAQLIDRFLNKPLEPSPMHVLSILGNNLLVSAISFLLSFFYGAGGIFLLVLNASIFASFVVYVSRQLARAPSDAVAVLGFFSIHLLPEILGFLIAAIAGGVVSKAILTERPFSPGFRNVMRDAVLLMLLSAGFTVLGAILEVYVTAPLFYHYF